MDISNETTANQYLSFILRDEHFAIEIFKVREVLDVSTLTKIPRMPDYLCGVINLRGNVVPVVDLGMKLGMEKVQNTVNTCIMIVEIQIESEEEKIPMGVLTDSVSEVLDINASDIEAAPKMGTNLNTDFINGMGRHDEKFLIMLDVDKILSVDGKAVLKDILAESEDEGE